MCVKPRKAATVSIIKNNSGAIEVLLMRRHLEDRFLPDYCVFPGGALDDRDFDYQFPEIKDSFKLREFNGKSEKYYGHIICGIRETFEESGILFAVDEKGTYPQISTPEQIEKFSSYRKQVFEKKISLKDMLGRENLYPAVDNFFYISRWITPAFFPIRYDARFFAAIAPENQEISHDGNELVDFQWITPNDALQNYRNGTIKLVTPTVKTLELLGRFHLADDVIESFQK